jgi:hypothetical protein
MIVLNEFMNGSPKRPFAHEDQLIQTRFLDRPNKTFRVCGVSQGYASVTAPPLGRSIISAFVSGSHGSLVLTCGEIPAASRFRTAVLQSRSHGAKRHLQTGQAPSIQFLDTTRPTSRVVLETCS